MTLPTQSSLVYQLQRELQQAREELYTTKALCCEEQARGRAELDNFRKKMSLPYSTIPLDEVEAASVAHLQEEISAVRRQNRDIRAQHEYMGSLQAHHQEELAKTVENNRKILSSVEEICIEKRNNKQMMFHFP
ncbi:unnamed protein product [Nippostrongylus brasiliensis]|uniref:CC171 protein n=1 Tax=Nippostrongylus brasiliensis TaxID=27835 RepID=A0A0N4XG47_NIPBR|nr:unnamed protein product [Nippostrongylus brasiliensis]